MKKVLFYLLAAGFGWGAIVSANNAFGFLPGASSIHAADLLANMAMTVVFGSLSIVLVVAARYSD